jgi:hypothetical protein
LAVRAIELIGEEGFTIREMYLRGVRLETMMEKCEGFGV